MANQLDGKVAVITGGGNGIGRATVLRFLREGASVVVADLNETTGLETVELAKKQGNASDRVCFLRTDVVEESQVESAVELARSKFGRLDCIFNNAGVAGAFGPITHISASDWDFTFAVLVRGVFFGMKHAARILKQQGQGGSIINTASVAGMGGGDGPQAYSAAKAAVINLSRAVAIELAPDRIRVNSICPGGILTPLLHRGQPEALQAVLEKAQPWPAAGQPEDIAAAATYLAADDSKFVTGASLVVDGGLTAVGGNAMRSLGQGSMLNSIVGLDRGSTGVDGTIRMVD